MRFTQFLIEEPGQIDWIKKEKRNAQRRNRTATANRAAQTRAAQQAAPMPGQRPPGQMPTLDMNTGKPVAEPKQSPAGPQRPAASGPDTVDMSHLPPEMAKMAGDRQTNLEMQSLLGAMYQARRRNPSVEMTPPKIVTMSKNKDMMMKLFKIAKDMQQADLAKFSQEIKQHANTPGATAGTVAAGQTSVPQTPGQTPAQKGTLQKLLGMIKDAAKHLSPHDMKAARKELDRAEKSARPNPPANPQQPYKPVVTTG